LYLLLLLLLLLLAFALPASTSTPLRHIHLSPICSLSRGSRGRSQGDDSGVDGVYVPRYLSCAECIPGTRAGTGTGTGTGTGGTGQYRVNGAGGNDELREMTLRQRGQVGIEWAEVVFVKPVSVLQLACSFCRASDVNVMWIEKCRCGSPSRAYRSIGRALPPREGNEQIEQPVELDRGMVMPEYVFHSLLALLDFTSPPSLSHALPPA
jgi:hypothetical protein